MTIALLAGFGLSQMPAVGRAADTADCLEAVFSAPPADNIVEQHTRKTRNRLCAFLAAQGQSLNCAARGGTGADLVAIVRSSGLCPARPALTEAEIDVALAKHAEFLRLKDARLPADPQLRLDWSCRRVVGVVAGNRLRRADLRGARLDGAAFDDARLEGARLSQASLIGASFNAGSLANAHLDRARLTCAALSGTRAGGASFDRASLMAAGLTAVDLSDANLTLSNLAAARLLNTDVGGARFQEAVLWRTTYQPVGSPDTRYLNGLKWLATMRLYPRLPNPTGMVALRGALKTAGQQQSRREVSAALERALTAEYWRALVSKSALPAAQSNSWLFNLVMWGRGAVLAVVVDFGLSPAFPLLLIALSVVPFAVAYILAIRYARRDMKSGIYLVRVPSRRTGERSEEPAGPAQTEMLPRQWPVAIRFGLWFSVLAATEVGWQNLSVSAWLRRLQSEEFGLAARGWPRVASGAHAILSIVLVITALGFLFGHPLE